MTEHELTPPEAGDPSQPQRGPSLYRRRDEHWRDALATEEFEVADHALGEVRELRAWRQAAARSAFRPFWNLVESVTLTGETQSTLVDDLTPLVRTLSPRAADLYFALLGTLEGTDVEPRFPATVKKLARLTADGDLDVLLDPRLPLAVKQNRLETRLEDYLAGSTALDRRDQAQLEAKVTESPTASPITPPPASDESQPSMDEMERTPEGEHAPAIWTINPAYGGYFKAASYNVWDAERHTWRQREQRYTEASPQLAVAQAGDRIESGALPARQWTNLNIPYTHEFVGLAQPTSGVVRQDQHGDWTVWSAEPTVIELVLRPLGEGQRRRLTADEPPSALVMPAHFSAETQHKLVEIATRKHGTLARARALASYTMRHLQYSNDSQYNAVYPTHPTGYFGGIDEYRQADCDVANTYFAALCSALKIPVRHTVGHMVKGKDDDGNSRITSGTGHGWTEVWDDVGQSWEVIDATPPGDPQLDDQPQSDDGEPVPGDYGAPEAVGLTDEQLAALEAKLAAVAEELSYTPAERALHAETDISLPEARQILREIRLAEDVKLPNGRRVLDALAQLFDMIVQSRTRFQVAYTGPLKRREGGQFISDVVAHHIGMLAGEADPRSRDVELPEATQERLVGGFDVFLIGDKSGSMTQTVEGESKWQMQRRVLYLILGALHSFQDKLTSSGVQSASSGALDVRTEVLSFRGNTARHLDTDKPLGPAFSDADKVRLWRSLTQQGGGNGDVVALQTVHEHIRREQEALADGDVSDNRLRLVLAMTDGYPDSETGVQAVAKQLGQRGAVVVGIGLTETAKAVQQIYSTPHSHGDYVQDINDLPIVVAKYVVNECLKLFPEKARLDSQRDLAALLAGFREES